jgi:hypothetical protein
MSDIGVAGPGFYSGLTEDGYRLQRGMYIEFPGLVRFRPTGSRKEKERQRAERRAFLAWEREHGPNPGHVITRIDHSTRTVTIGSAA